MGYIQPRGQNTNNNKERDTLEGVKTTQAETNAGIYKTKITCSKNNATNVEKLLI